MMDISVTIAILKIKLMQTYTLSYFYNKIVRKKYEKHELVLASEGRGKNAP